MFSFPIESAHRNWITLPWENGSRWPRAASRCGGCWLWLFKFTEMSVQFGSNDGWGAVDTIYSVPNVMWWAKRWNLKHDTKNFSTFGRPQPIASQNYFLLQCQWKSNLIKSIWQIKLTPLWREFIFNAVTIMQIIYFVVLFSFHIRIIKFSYSISYPKYNTEHMVDGGGVR